MELHVSEVANFALFKPVGWRVSEEAGGGRQILKVTHPNGVAEVEVAYGESHERLGPYGVLRELTVSTSQSRRNVVFERVMVSADGTRLVVDSTYQNEHSRPYRARTWISTRDRQFYVASCAAVEGEFSTYMEVMLNTIVNMRALEGAVLGSSNAQEGPRALPLQTHRLADGSASFGLPEGWACRELGRGQVWCVDPNSRASFGVATAAVISPALGVHVPGTPMAYFMAPSDALPFIARSQGLADNFRIEWQQDRTDLARQLAAVYTAGPVLVGELLYTCDPADGGRIKGYTFGFSFGSRLQTNWSFTHMTVTAPQGTFDDLTPTFASMLHSFEIDQAWARRYVAEGARRLASMTRRTSQMITRNAHEIREIQNSMYEGRQRSRDYTDYVFTSYMRGESDWISEVEGGTVYRSDSWGLTDTTTGDFWEENGEPGHRRRDYVNYRGENPRYREQMQEVNSREAWERAFGNR